MNILRIHKGSIFELSDDHIVQVTGWSWGRNMSRVFIREVKGPVHSGEALNIPNGRMMVFGNVLYLIGDSIGDIIEEARIRWGK